MTAHQELDPVFLPFLLTATLARRVQVRHREAESRAHNANAGRRDTARI